MTAIVAIISIVSFFVGQLLVTRRCFAGFLIWAGSNLLVATFKFATGDASTGSLFLIYAAANTYSLIAWFHPRNRAGNNTLTTNTLRNSQAFDNPDLRES